jgi:hypothetical protein
MTAARFGKIPTTAGPLQLLADLYLGRVHHDAIDQRHHERSS